MPRLLQVALLLLCAGAFAEPSTVTLVGNFQSVVGCATAPDPHCAATAMIPGSDGVWRLALELPAGTWSHRPASDGAPLDAPERTFTLSSAAKVRFYFDPRSAHWASEQDAAIATAVGSFQTHLGCAAWAPACLRSWLQDRGDGELHSFVTQALPAGTYQAKVAHNESWDENYGEHGVRDGENISFTVSSAGSTVVFAYHLSTHQLTIHEYPRHGVDLTLARAHWLAPETISWPLGEVPPGTRFWLQHGEGERIALVPEPAGLSSDLRTRFVHLAGHAALRLPPLEPGELRRLLQGKLAVLAESPEGIALGATLLQLPGVLDHLFTYRGPLGASFDADRRPTLRLWAPTARAVTLLLFPTSTATEPVSLPMVLDEAKGVWTASGEPEWHERFYLYEVEVYVPALDAVVKNRVTDPYSVSLSTNSQRSHLVDLADPRLSPPGWATLQKPALERPEDIVLYELHLRDFSASDPEVPAPLRGTFRAFTVEDSHGMKHLARLAQAGVSHLHLLPVFDIASVDERRSTWQEPAGDLAASPPDAEAQQAAVTSVAGKDGFNWGYDPYHYTVPEGSYATDPDGAGRILEFRQMVQALSAIGLRVVMDVVYNHTHASGQNPLSVLDRIVPGYYHRLDADGRVETSTCCQNTATEHAMMEKLMVDSLLIWARAYRVDGFRFDLMGHHSRANMEKVRDALAALTVEADGVDGSKLYLYGEGWDFGEVGNGARFVNASQKNIGGTGIGAFNDRVRDAVRGGGAFSGLREQGFATGLLTAPNGTPQGSEADQALRLRLLVDRIKVALAGNLAQARLVDAWGKEVSGAEVDYHGQPTGYALAPQETVNYVSAHDNETLFDAIQLKAPPTATSAERVRMNTLALSIVALGQGIPFFHAGDELLRSKSLDRNSYDSGDWFNRLDFSYQTNNWGVGLPPAPDNQSHWSVMKPLLGNLALQVTPGDILRARDGFEELLRIRRSSSLFRLRSAEEVRTRVRFENAGPGQVPGLIVMHLLGPSEEGHSRVVVVFNASPQPRTFRSPELTGLNLALHPLQAASPDPIVRSARFDAANAALEVPGWTTAVFIESAPPAPAARGCSCAGTATGAMGMLALLLALVRGRRLLTRSRSRSS